MIGLSESALLNLSIYDNVAAYVTVSENDDAVVPDNDERGGVVGAAFDGGAGDVLSADIKVKGEMKPNEFVLMDARLKAIEDMLKVTKPAPTVDPNIIEISSDEDEDAEANFDPKVTSTMFSHHNIKEE